MLCGGSCHDGGGCCGGGGRGVVVVAVVGTALVMVAVVKEKGTLNGVGEKNEAADTPIFNIHEKMKFYCFDFFTKNCADIVKTCN